MSTRKTVSTPEVSKEVTVQVTIKFPSFRNFLESYEEIQESITSYAEISKVVVKVPATEMDVTSL